MDKVGALGAIVHSFKSAATKQINEMRDTPDYHDRIVRDTRTMNAIRRYIVQNPQK